MTTTEMYYPKGLFDMPEGQIETPESEGARSEAAAGASIYRRLDAGRRQPKIVKFAPAVALGILVVGGGIAYLTMGQPAHQPAPTQVAQAAPPAQAPLPAAAIPATPAAAPVAPPSPGLKVTHEAPPAPTRLARAAPRHAARHARSHAAIPSASDQGVDTSATLAPTPPAPAAMAPAPVAPSVSPPTVQAPPEPAAAPPAPS